MWIANTDTGRDYRIIDFLLAQGENEEIHEGVENDAQDNGDNLTPPQGGAGNSPPPPPPPPAPNGGNMPNHTNQQWKYYYGKWDFLTFNLKIDDFEQVWKLFDNYKVNFKNNLYFRPFLAADGWTRIINY